MDTSWEEGFEKRIDMRKEGEGRHENGNTVVKDGRGGLSLE